MIVSVECQILLYPQYACPEHGYDSFWFHTDETVMNQYEVHQICRFTIQRRGRRRCVNARGLSVGIFDMRRMRCMCF